MSQYQFTNNWFARTAKPFFDDVIRDLKPKKILEVGSYEGASACYLIENLGLTSDIEVHCVDHWEGGIEHQSGGAAQTNMRHVRSRFDQNIATAVKKIPRKANVVIHGSYSDMALANLLSQNKRNYFDFVYIDGSHQAADVLADGVLAFRLLRIGGIMAFDDYLWAEPLATGVDPLRCPKLAIDAFINIHIRKLSVGAPPYRQMIVQKTRD